MTSLDNLPPEYAAQIEELQRKRQMAQMLSQQAFQSMQQPTQVIGNRAVKTNPLGMIAQVLSGYLGHQQAGKAQEGIGQIQQQAAQQRQQGLQGLQENPQAGFTSSDPVLRQVAEALSQQEMRKAQMEQMRQKAIPQPTIAGPGAIARDQAGNILWQNPDKPAAPDKPPSAVQEFEFAKSQGFKGSFEQWKKEIARAGASSTNVSYGAPVAGVDEKGNPLFFQPDRKGGAPAIVSGVRPPPRADTHPGVEEGKIAAYASQMLAAEAELGKLPSQGNLPSQVATAAAGSPLSMLAPAAAQQVNQAKQQWAEAFLRFKTGAAAPEAEVARNIDTFFPKVGDKAEVVAQKERMRAKAIADVKAAAGRASGRVSLGGPAVTLPPGVREVPSGN
jgi:hypothetical protein